MVIICRVVVSEAKAQKLREACKGRRLASLLWPKIQKVFYLNALQQKVFLYVK
jgi:hypothetical protein